MGITVTEMSAMSVPDTTGVMIRRSRTRRAATPSWKSPEAITSTASSAGPPAASASTATPIEAPEAPMTIRLAPPRPATRRAWTMVVSPPMTMLAKMAQER